MRLQLIFYSEQPEEKIRKYLDLICKEGYDTYYYNGGLYTVFFYCSNMTTLPIDSINLLLRKHESLNMNSAIIILDESGNIIPTLNVREISTKRITNDETNLTAWGKVRNKIMKERGIQ